MIVIEFRKHCAYTNSARSDMEYIRSKGGTDNFCFDGEMGTRMIAGLVLSLPHVKGNGLKYNNNNKNNKNNNNNNK